MKQCKCCNATLDKESINQSFTRIERLLRLQGIDAPMVKQVAKDSGPMCGRCLRSWTKELSTI